MDAESSKLVVLEHQQLFLQDVSHIKSMHVEPLFRQVNARDDVQCLFSLLGDTNSTTVVSPHTHIAQRWHTLQGNKHGTYSQRSRT